MKKTALIYFLLMMPAFSVFALPSADQAKFEKAGIAYREDKYDEAAALYKALTEKYPYAAVFQYNLGNALHRKGEIGTAIVAYERARFLSPRSSDISANLNYVRSLVEYRIEDKRNELIKIAEKLLGYFTFDEMLLSFLVLLFLLLGGWGWALFFKQDASWGFFRKFTLLLTLVFSVLLLVKMIQINFFRESVIVAKQAQVYYGPSVTDQAAFQLGEGLKVYEVDEREGWSRILIASGEIGWIQKELIAEIRPRSKA